MAIRSGRLVSARMKREDYHDRRFTNCTGGGDPGAGNVTAVLVPAAVF
jgi:hypothetical protein